MLAGTYTPTVEPTSQAGTSYHGLACEAAFPPAHAPL